MSSRVYDVAMAGAWAMVSAGAWLQWGTAVGLMVSGVWLAAATLAGVVLTRGAR